MNRTYSKIIKHINMHAYTNFTSYGEKLSIHIHVQGLNSRYLEHYWEDLYSELYCDTNRYVLVHTKYNAIIFLYIQDLN